MWTLLAFALAADPDWDGHRNRLVPEPPPLTKQSFGWRPTNVAKGKAPGELGGLVSRSLTPASYQRPLSARTLAERRTVSGRFAVTKAGGAGGVLLGFRSRDSRGWRTPNSLAVRVDGNGSKFWVFFEYGTASGLTGGAGAFEGEFYQTTKSNPFPADGTPHDFALEYDPAGDGRISFTIDGRTYRHALAMGHKADGATFDRFGLWNQEIAGDGTELAVDDLVVDGESLDFTADPKWEAKGNDVTFPDRGQRGRHDFGSTTAGDTLAGLVWRDEKPAYCARTVEPVTLDVPFSRSGTFALNAAGADSAVYVGWFDAAAKKANDVPEHLKPQPSFVAFLVEGPSRVGHYARPAARNRVREGGALKTGPVVRPDGKPRDWTLSYRPNADGTGTVTLVWDGTTMTYEFTAAERKAGARFDRFGAFNHQSGGSFVDVTIRLR